uniref:Uncharacterized protein n=1 Tax=Cannabis sativa TaxID=3483 RepID=A0A803PWE7_CANSA
MGHSKSFCLKPFFTPRDKIVKPYGDCMRAKPRLRNQLICTKWLRTFTDFSSLDGGGSIDRDGEDTQKETVHASMIMGQIIYGPSHGDGPLMAIDSKRRKTDMGLKFGPNDIFEKDQDDELSVEWVNGSKNNLHVGSGFQDHRALGVY